MVYDTLTTVIPGRAPRDPGISRHNVGIPDRAATRPVRNDGKR
jgi:hypothetical protein